MVDKKRVCIKKRQGICSYPKDESLRLEIIWLHHNILTAGHG